ADDFELLPRHAAPAVAPAQRSRGVNLVPTLCVGTRVPTLCVVGVVRHSSAARRRLRNRPSALNAETGWKPVRNLPNGHSPPSTEWNGLPIAWLRAAS